MNLLQTATSNNLSETSNLPGILESLSPEVGPFGLQNDLKIDINSVLLGRLEMHGFVINLSAK